MQTYVQAVVISLRRLPENPRVVIDYGLRSGNAELISNTCIAEGEIVAVFGETATICPTCLDAPCRVSVVMVQVFCLPLVPPVFRSRARVWLHELWGSTFFAPLLCGSGSSQDEVREFERVAVKQNASTYSPRNARKAPRPQRLWGRPKQGRFEAKSYFRKKPLGTQRDLQVKTPLTHSTCLQPYPAGRAETSACDGCTRTFSPPS